MPVEAPIEANDVLLLVHVPPPVLSKVIVPLTQTDVGPDIADGNGLTVTPYELTQPAAETYAILTGPATIPLTTPVEDPTVAMAGLLLTQAPPVVVVLSTVVDPTQTFAGPVIGAGNAFTVTTVEI
jgi:hypothetical protein